MKTREFAAGVACVDGFKFHASRAIRECVSPQHKASMGERMSRVMAVEKLGWPMKVSSQRALK
jgi:hypothetical protein